MPTTQYLGTHVLIGDRAGTAAVKSTSFAEIGITSGVNVEPVRDPKEIWAPSPGKLKRVDVLDPKVGTNFTATIQQTGKEMWELLFGSLPLTAGSAVQYNPHEATAATKAWIKFQQYNESDTLINTVDVWCHMSANAISFADGNVTWELKGMVIESTLNTGVLSTLA